MKKALQGFLVLSAVLFAYGVLMLPAYAGVLPLLGKTIALDAGHGSGETGAIGYCGSTAVVEADVNISVRAELAQRITDGGGTAYLVQQLATRSDRVADAESAGSDVLISIHHNGSSNTSADYTQSFVTQKNDKEFASYIHPAIVAALDLFDKGIKSDGYGMTVYGSLPGILTEAYFVTNTVAACDYLNYLSGATDTRVQKEAQADYDGLVAYFARPISGKGRGN